ncbi:helix-turn-helix domain-containing protein [Ferrovibrio sp.]|uniref:helix-turn-helix domain-containing protein n=1 Tax=Ferrovibrio sp. TaxID=1917215 RepID=UPI001B71CDCC|nr:helix-turn-helix domain-containing protein [Ferrovibrio sp.]MBP7065770.1 helix-turn-helix domain-containing protein [Ferrovibrio sp.]
MKPTGNQRRRVNPAAQREETREIMPPVSAKSAAEPQSFGDLGGTLRNLRMTRGLTQQEAAKQAGVTKGYMSKVEAGTAAPSIAVLSRLAEVYRFKLSDIFEDKETASPFCLVRATERRRINRDGSELGYVFESLSYRKKDRRAEIFLLHLPPIKAPKLLYRHRGEEIFFVMSGKVRFIYGSAEYLLDAGDCVYFDPSVDHRGEAAGADPAQAFVVILGPETKAAAGSIAKVGKPAAPPGNKSRRK